MEPLVFQVSDFVASVNQTFEYAYPFVQVEGEVANFRISKNKWVYFDLKDSNASVRCFGTVYSLPGPLDDGMTVRVSAAPRLHTLYGFSLTVQSVRPIGEGSIKKASKLLAKKLEVEGLFAPERKRSLPYPPTQIGLVTSRESAAYADFIKILKARWPLVTVVFAHVGVQGESAGAEIVSAMQLLNETAKGIEVIVVVRGGGSADDLAVFSTEHVVRAIAASRIPTLVAIGHEVDTSLAERAADRHASTPSNAAELLVPDRYELLERFDAMKMQAHNLVQTRMRTEYDALKRGEAELIRIVRDRISFERRHIEHSAALIDSSSPNRALQRGYAILRNDTGQAVRSVSGVHPGDPLTAQVSGGIIHMNVTSIEG